MADNTVFLEQLERTIADAKPSAAIEYWQVQRVVKAIWPLLATLRADLATAKAECERLTIQRDEFQQALHALLKDEPLPNGQYVHLLYCNGNHRAPVGSKEAGIENCPIGQRIRGERKRAEAAEAEAQRWFEGVDNSSHHYLVPLEREAEWDAWCDIPEDDERSWDVPAYAVRKDGGRLTFTAPEIAGQAVAALTPTGQPTPPRTEDK